MLGADEVLRIVVRRHVLVQSGKYDRGERKSAWVELFDGDTRGRLKAQRYQLPSSQRVDTWRDMGRHPYRTGPALAFIRACSIK